MAKTDTWEAIKIQFVATFRIACLTEPEQIGEACDRFRESFVEDMAKNDPRAIAYLVQLLYALLLEVVVPSGEATCEQEALAKIDQAIDNIIFNSTRAEMGLDG